MHFETWLMIREQSENNGHVGLCGNMHVFHIFLKKLVSHKSTNIFKNNKNPGKQNGRIVSISLFLSKHLKF